MIRSAMLLLALTLAPLLARADEPPAVLHWWVQAQGGASYISDRSFDVVAATDPVGLADIRAGFVPGWAKDHLELDLGYTGGILGGETLGTFTSSYEVHTLQVGARYRQQLGSFFSAYLRVAGLLDFNGLHLSDTAESVHLTQWALTGGLLFNVGGELTLYSWNSARLGTLLEFGYAQRFNQARFDKVALEHTGKDSLAMTPVNVGSLDVSGIQWRLGMVVHF